MDWRDRVDTWAVVAVMVLETLTRKLQYSLLSCFLTFKVIPRAVVILYLVGMNLTEVWKQLLEVFTNHLSRFPRLGRETPMTFIITFTDHSTLNDTVQKIGTM